MSETVNATRLSGAAPPLWEMNQMASTVHDLAAVTLLQGVGQEALAAIAAQARQRIYARNETIVREGEPCRQAFFITQGFVRVGMLSIDGREHVLAYLGPGASLNLVGVLDGGVNLANVDALSDTRLSAVRAEMYRELSDRFPSLALANSRQLAHDMRRLSLMMQELVFHTVRTRLARFLLSNAETDTTTRRWTQEMIASHLGTVRDVVGRELRAFASAGLVRRERGRLVILDRDRLEQEANHE